MSIMKLKLCLLGRFLHTRKSAHAICDEKACGKLGNNVFLAQRQDPTLGKLLKKGLKE